MYADGEIRVRLLCIHRICARNSSGSGQRSAEKSHQVVLKYLGTAGWEITDGTTSILIDPYLSRINGPTPPGGGTGHSLAGDTRRAYGWNDVASPDVAAIDPHIQRAGDVAGTVQE